MGTTLPGHRIDWFANQTWSRPEGRFFPPQHATPEAAATELQEVVRRSPRLYGLKRSRWWLDGLRQKVSWLNGLSLPGVHKILRRLKISYKRGRRYVHSPDPEYDDKLAMLQMPTYAPWTNPTEKVWRKLYQEVLHLHDFADCWDKLKVEVGSWLEQFADGSTELLRYVGLCPG